MQQGYKKERSMATKKKKAPAKKKNLTKAVTKNKPVKKKAKLGDGLLSRAIAAKRARKRLLESL